MLGDASPPVTRSMGASEPVEQAALYLVGEPSAVRGADRPLLGDQHSRGLGDAPTDRVPVDAGPVQPTQVDHFGVYSSGLHCIEDVARHREIRQHRDRRADSAHGGLADGDAVVPVIGRPLAAPGVEVEVLQHHHGVLAAQSAVHETDVVERRGRGDDAPAGGGDEHACRIHRVLRTVACAHRHLAPEHERDIAAAAEHMPCLADLVEQLVGGHPHEVGVHQFNDRREAPVEGDATRRARRRRSR